MDTVDVVVIGAGVVGLAVARELAAKGRETWLLEAAQRFGTAVSARSSEVIHAGIYYPAGSLKARLCVAGRERLYAFCEGKQIEHRRCGKLIVATSEPQVTELRSIQARASANGVELEALDRAGAQALEPALECRAALHSPASGIIDSHSYMQALLGDAESHAANLVCNTRVTRMRRDANELLIAVNGEEFSLRARTVVNCAGLAAPEVAASLEGFPARQLPHPYFAKGNYFSLSGPAPFQRLIYPLPEPGGLGIHLTLDLAGRARFGPDVQWLAERDYSVDATRAEHFYSSIRQYWPALPRGSLQPAYAAIRPRIWGPGQPEADFRIDGPQVHRVPGFVTLFGIESPGLTASLAIAEHVAALISNDDAQLA